MKIDDIPRPLLVVGAVVFFGFAGYKFFVAGNSEATFNAGGCQIKGNIRPLTGERIFYVPGHKDYLRIGVSKKDGERWFCTEVEAMSSGWIKARR